MAEYLYDAIVTTHKTYPSVQALHEVTGVPIKYPWEIDYGESILNWGLVGNNGMADMQYNETYAVACALHKPTAFMLMKKYDVPTLPFTMKWAEAKAWYNEGRTVYVRKHASGSGGSGIVLCKKGERPLIRGQFYTRFVKPTREVRVLATDDPAFPAAIFVKRRMRAPALAELGLEKADYWIRTHKNGWVFTDPKPSEEYWLSEVGAIASSAVQSLGLSFAAVDMSVILKNEGGLSKARVIEVNTAPGIENTRTREWFRNYLRGNNAADTEI